VTIRMLGSRAIVECGVTRLLLSEIPPRAARGAG